MVAGLTQGKLIAGRYRLDALVGQGGMGVVWSATHLVTQRRVALKFLKSDASPDDRERFLREARAASAVHHPNVVSIDDVLELEDGPPTLVMDLLEGETLASRLRRGPLTIDEFARIMVPVVSAVGFAHAVGVVHRDLKPDNVFLTREAGGEGIRVLDFGIAKLTAFDDRAERLTQSGALLGTPSYMSPEQILGDRSIDHRSDIWSLGVVFYECLAGQRPTDAETVGKVLQLVLNGAIRPLVELAPGTPGPLARLVMSMLESKRERRPADLRAVMDVLRRYTDATAPAFAQPSIPPPMLDGLIQVKIPPLRAVLLQIEPPRGGDTLASAGLAPEGPGGPLRPSSIDTLKDAAPPPPPHGEVTFTAPGKATISSPPAADGAGSEGPAEAAAEAADAEAPEAAASAGGPAAPEAAAGSEAARQGPETVAPPREGPGGVESQAVLTPRTRRRRRGAALALAGLVAACCLLALRGDAAKPAAPAAPGPCPPGMVYHGGGFFRMGSDEGVPEAKPAHPEQVEPFCLDRTEVTVGAYTGCVARGGCSPPGQTVQWADADRAYVELESPRCVGHEFSKPHFPINCVSWEQADAFCRAEGKRLPGEDEWEFAAVNGERNDPFPWGDGPLSPSRSNLCDGPCVGYYAPVSQGMQAIFPEDGHTFVAPVGRFPEGASRAGVLDLMGNVWEWTASPFCPYPERRCTSPYRVFRGAGWATWIPAYVRPTTRLHSAVGHRYADVGFRCAAAPR